MARITIELSDELLKKVGTTAKDLVLRADALVLHQYRDKNGTQVFGLAGYDVSGEPTESTRALGNPFHEVIDVMASDMAAQIRNLSAPVVVDEKHLHAPEPTTAPEPAPTAVLYKADPSVFQRKIPKSYGEGFDVQKIPHLDYYDGGTAQKRIFPDTVYHAEDWTIEDHEFLNPDTNQMEVHKAITLEVDPIRNGGERYKVLKLKPLQ